MIQWTEVAAFIGPLIAAIVGLGLFVGWTINRVTKFVESQIANVQALTNERIKTLTEELATQNRILEQVRLDQVSTATAIARIEGRLSASQNPNPTQGTV